MQPNEKISIFCNLLIFLILSISRILDLFSVILLFGLSLGLLIDVVDSDLLSCDAFLSGDLLVLTPLLLFN